MKRQVPIRTTRGYQIWPNPQGIVNIDVCSKSLAFKHRLVHRVIPEQIAVHVDGKQRLGTPVRRSEAQ